MTDFPLTRRRLTLGAAALAAGLGALTPAAALAQGEVNIYSYRQESLIKPLLDAFTEKTGIETNVVYGSKGLEERIKAEGANSPADLLLTTDIGNLDGAKAAGITQAVESETLNDNIPANFRDPEGHWFGLTARARIVYASAERVDQDTISYADLADPKWKGRICTRSGQHQYTIGLIASIIAHEGEEKAEEWLAGVRDNLARKPTGNDRAQVQAIHAGECDLAIGNTYYMGLMQTNEKEPEQQDWAKSVRILFPDSEGRGSHVNISGMVMAENAPNRDNAVKLMEFLSSDEAQAIYAEANYEYPVNPDVATSERVSSWGTLKPDSLSLAEIAENRKAASEMVDRIGFDDGPQS